MPDLRFFAGEWIRGCAGHTSENRHTPHLNLVNLLLLAIRAAALDHDPESLRIWNRRGSGSGQMDQRSLRRFGRLGMQSSGSHGIQSLGSVRDRSLGQLHGSHIRPRNPLRAWHGRSHRRTCDFVPLCLRRSLKVDQLGASGVDNGARHCENCYQRHCQPRRICSRRRPVHVQYSSDPS
jgi:hypothetical protein